jgi:hypothetical protein
LGKAVYSNSNEEEYSSRFFVNMYIGRLILLALALLILLWFGLACYAVIAGEIYLIRGTIRGPLARLIGVLMILSLIVGLPIMFRVLVGMTMNLGH